MLPPILLASSSPYRALLLKKLGLNFVQDSPNIDETARVNESAGDLAKRLSLAKAQALQPHYPKHVIIASDQVACAPNGVLLGKPHTVEKAIKQLLAVNNQKIIFYTSLTVLCPIEYAPLNHSQTILETFTVHFRDLSKAQIMQYIAREMPLDCAGSFKSEGLGISLFTKLEGDDPNTLIGLPMITLCQLLNNIGIDVLNLPDAKTNVNE